MAKVTYKNLYQLVVNEIQKRQKFLKTDKYSDQLNRTSVAPLGSVYPSALSDVTTAELVTAVQNLLRESLSAKIITGLDVKATDPISDSVIITAGKGVVAGNIYELDDDTTIKIPFDNTTSVFYVNLYLDRILIDKNKHSDKLTIAKIVVPKPGVTNRVKNNKDDDYEWDAYIVNFRTLELYVDANNKLEEDSLEILRDNISPILADNLIGNIRLNEDLKIINTAGTLELNSDSLKLYDENDNLLAKFNEKGVYFYNTTGVELARFTNIDARIGNILITKNSIQSENFVSGVSGFKISDTGDVEFDDATIRGTIYATSGLIGGFNIASNKLYGGTIQTSENVAAGENGVIMDSSGLRGYSSTLGLVFNLPTDGSAPTFSSGIIEKTTFEVQTNAVIRTSETVGDGSSNSAGILINNTGLYGCEANQTLNEANLKALTDGTIKLKGEIISTQGQIGSVTITENSLSGGLIEGVTLIAQTIETSSTTPRVRIDEDGIAYELTTNTGKYGNFQYGDGTLYGAGASAFLFNSNYPPFSVVSELDLADIRLFNRTSDPGSGTGPHEVGDLIVVDGVLKICTVAGSPGTFAPVGSAASLDDLTDVNISSPSDGEVLTYNSTSGKWENQTSSSASGEAVIKQISQTSHGFSVGDVLRYDSSASSYVKAQANSTANAEVVGIVSQVVDSDNFKLLTHGYISGLSGLTAGTVYFLSDNTAGLLTDTEPTSEGSITKPLLVAISSTEGIFINYRGVEITDSTSFYGSFTDSDLSSGVLTITHNLGHTYCSVTIIDNNNKVITPDDITYVDENSLEVDLSSFGTLTGTWRYVVLDVGAANTSTPKKIQDTDGDTLLDTEESADKDEIVGKVAGVEALRIYSSGILDLPKQSGCRIERTTDQTLTQGSWNKIEFNSEDWDAQNEYDNSTNYRWTATKSGKYFVIVCLYFADHSAGDRFYISIKKNGSEYDRFYIIAPTTEPISGLSVSKILVNANDYIEIHVYPYNHNVRLAGGTPHSCRLIISKTN